MNILVNEFMQLSTFLKRRISFRTKIISYLKCREKNPKEKSCVYAIVSSDFLKKTSEKRSGLKQLDVKFQITEFGGLCQIGCGSMTKLEFKAST